MRATATHRPRVGFTLPEILISLGLVVVLLAIVLPALSAARSTSHRDECQSNQRQIGAAWSSYLEENDGQFPTVADDPAWRYGGVGFSSVDNTPFLDFMRPLTRHLPARLARIPNESFFRCPADHGIKTASGDVVTGRRTAFRSYGTSYRAVAGLCNCIRAGIDEDEPRGLFLGEITTMPSRQALNGDPLWYEVRADTGRLAHWHGKPHHANVLFLDGSVRFVDVRAGAPQPVSFEMDLSKKDANADAATHGTLTPP